jgi:hypothetical protein
MPIVGIEKIAEALNLTPRRVQQLVPEGMPREGRGQYDPVKCLLFYVRYLQRKLEEKSAAGAEGEISGERSARVRRVEADCEMKELILAERRKKLVAISDAERALTEMELTVKTRLQAMVTRIAGELVGVKSPVMTQALLEKGIKDALVQISKGPISQMR